jgi:hydrogenase maturation protease
MSRILIIGYGNPLRGDDAFGWRVTERLRALIADPEIEILTVHQLTPELMDPLSAAALAIFVDASEDREPGVLIERRLEPRAGAASFTHRATPEALLAGARALYGHAAEAVMISVAGADFSLGAELSPPVAGRKEEAVAAVLRWIEGRRDPTVRSSCAP